MDFVTLSLGLLTGYIVGRFVCWMFEVRPLIRTIVEMKKLGFNEYMLPEPKEESMYPFVRED